MRADFEIAIGLALQRFECRLGIPPADLGVGAAADGGTLDEPARGMRGNRRVGGNDDCLIRGWRKQRQQQNDQGCTSSAKSALAARRVNETSPRNPRRESPTIIPEPPAESRPVSHSGRSAL